MSKATALLTLHRNTSMSCKAIVPKTAVIIILAMIKIIAMKLEKFLIVKSLKLGNRCPGAHPEIFKRGGSDTVRRQKWPILMLLSKFDYYY